MKRHSKFGNQERLTVKPLENPAAYWVAEREEDFVKPRRIGLGVMTRGRDSAKDDRIAHGA